MVATDATGGAKPADPKTEKAEPPKPDLDVTKDTVARGDKTSGLARVLVQGEAKYLADDVADLILNALDRHEHAGAVVHVVDTVGALRAADVLAVVDHQVTALEAALDAALPAEQPERYTYIGLAVGSFAMATAALAGPVLSAAGIVGKLLAHDYHLSGAVVDVADGLGFDLQVAERLRAKRPDVTVSVDRVRPTVVTESEIVGRVALIERRAQTALARALAEAASTKARTRAGADAVQARVTSLQSQITEAIKVAHHEGLIAQLREELAATHADLAGATSAASDAAADHDVLATLAAEVAEFLSSVTTPAAGGRAPLVDAARAEALTAGGTHLLYARLTTGGVDEVLDVRPFLSDTWTWLVGAGAEFALVCDGTVLASGGRVAVHRRRLRLSGRGRMTPDVVDYNAVPAHRPRRR